MLAASRGQVLSRVQQPAVAAPLRSSLALPVRSSVSVAIKPTKAADFQGLSDGGCPSFMCGVAVRCGDDRLPG